MLWWAEDQECSMLQEHLNVGQVCEKYLLVERQPIQGTLKGLVLVVVVMVPKEY